MKAPVKDYQVLLRLTKLWKTINENSHALSQLRDEAAKECWLWDFLSQDATLTPETLQSEDYQEKTKKFGTTLQEKIFDKWINLEPLWHLTLNLTSPDWHARAFLEGSNLSADDIAMLTDFGIIDVVYPEDILPANKPEKDDTTNA